MAPDIDAASILFGLEAYGKWHHVLAHGLFAALVVSAAAGAAAVKRSTTAASAFLAFHVHLLTDLFGSGPAWPIVYLWPVSEKETFGPIAWALNSWQNVVMTIVALAAIGFIGVTKGRTFAESFLPARLDRAVVEALRLRFAPVRPER